MLDRSGETALPKRYVVLGCGGFVGSHYLDRLLLDEAELGVRLVRRLL